MDVDCLVVLEVKVQLNRVGCKNTVGVLAASSQGL